MTAIFVCMKSRHKPVPTRRRYYRKRENPISVEYCSRIHLGTKYRKNFHVYFPVITALTSKFFSPEIERNWSIYITSAVSHWHGFLSRAESSPYCLRLWQHGMTFDETLMGLQRVSVILFRFHTLHFESEKSYSHEHEN